MYLYVKNIVFKCMCKLKDIFCLFLYEYVCCMNCDIFIGEMLTSMVYM